VAAKKAEFLVLEIEKTALPPLDSASAASVVSLQSHPGFQYLLAKLRVQRAALKHALETQRQKELKDFEFLQSGANWCNWLQVQLDEAVKLTQQPKPRNATAYEREAFEQLRSQLDVVGVGSRATTPGEVGPQAREVAPNE
jgi:hypothetical protein